MSTLTMPLLDSILAAKGLLNHISKDDVTPIIRQAAVIEYMDNRYLVATDRYSIGRFILGAHDAFEGDFNQTIPSDALLWVSKIMPKTLRRGTAPIAFNEGGYVVRFSWSESGAGSGKLEIEVAIMFGDKVERSQMYDVVSGTFPEIARLWRESDVAREPTAEVCLSHMSLLKIAADVALFDSKQGSVPLEFHSPGSKIAPVQYRIGTRWSAIVQPNVNLR